MMEFFLNLFEILKNIAVPRPCHSSSLGKVIDYIKGVLTSNGIPFTTQEVTLMPYKQLFLGIFCLVLGIVFFIFILKNKPVFAMLCILVIAAVLILETEFFINIVSPLNTKKSENIIMTFDVPEPQRELIFAAHMDSKTDFFDHVHRSNIMMFLLPVAVISLLLSMYLLLARKLKKLNHRIPILFIRVFAGLFIVFWFFFFLRMGGFVFLKKQSPGAVDDGAAVVSLIDLADELNKETINQGYSRITILLFTGEEVGLQGSGAYVKEFYKKADRKGALPSYLVNLELVAQNGNLLFWEKSGIFLRYYSSNRELINRIGKAWNIVSGKEISSMKGFGDDSYMFRIRGIPSITIGHSGEPGLGLAGFHTPADNLERVNMENLEIMTPLFRNFIESYTDNSKDSLIF